MKIKTFLSIALSAALIAGELQAQTIYDNDSLDGANVVFGGGPGFPASRVLLGDDISTIAPPNAGDEWQVDAVAINLLVFGNGVSQDTFTDVAIEVNILADVVTDPASGANTAALFGIAPVLGSETFAVGDLTSSPTGGNILIPLTLNFTTPVNIGDGQDIGITFGFSDTTMGAEDGNITMTYRNNGDANEPSIGSTSRFNFRDENLNGIIDATDGFGFTSDARLRFALDASVASGAEFVAPSGVTLFRGIELNGDVSDFADSDDVVASYNPGFTLNDTEAPVWLEFDGNAASATNFLVESSAGTPGLEYTFSAWNFANGSFDVVGTQVEAFNTDQVVTFPIVAADHIDANGDVRSRVGWRAVGFTINFPWQVNVDQTGWNQ